jgi:hypothetical protein
MPHSSRGRPDSSDISSNKYDIKPLFDPPGRIRLIIFKKFPSLQELNDLAKSSGGKARKL